MFNYYVQNAELLGLYMLTQLETMILGKINLGLSPFCTHAPA